MDPKHRTPRSLGDPVVFTAQQSEWKTGSASDSGVRLAVVIGGFHLEDIGDDAVDLHVADEPSEEQLLCDCGADQPEGGETHQQLGEPEKGGRRKSNMCCAAASLPRGRPLGTDR